MTEFEGQVLADLSVLKSQMQELMGIGQPGRLHQLERKVEAHGRSVQRLKGFVGGFGGLLTGRAWVDCLLWREALMGFLKTFLRGMALLPSLIQGVEGMFGEKAGAEKKKAALEIVGAAINVADAVEGRQIADSAGFTDGLGKIIDGVVECLNASVWHRGS